MTGHTVDHVTGDLHQITVLRGDVSFHAFYADRGGGVLVDTTFESTVDEVIEAVDAFGGVEALCVTHDHPDHAGGIDAVREAFDPAVLVPVNEADLVGSLDPPADVEYEDGDVFYGLEAIHCPGDTPGSHALLSHPDDALIAGDVVVGADLRGLPPGYLLPPPAVFAEDMGTAELAIDCLLDHDFDHVLVAHGSNVLENGYERLREFAYFPARPD